MRKPFKINDARVLCKIAEVRSIRVAAEQLGMAQSNVSKLLISIEKDIGLDIFIRNGNKLTLTKIGGDVVNHLYDFIDKENSIHNVINNYKKEKKGSVSIYASTGIITSLVNKFIPSLNDSGDISLIFRTIGVQNDSFDDGTDFPIDCDILISFFLPKNISLIAVPVLPLSFNVFASREYLNTNPINSPEELSMHNCIIMKNNVNTHENVWRLSSKGTDLYEVSGKYSCDNFSTACTLARAGRGLVYAPWEALSEDIRNGTLIPCFDFKTSYKRNLFVIYKKREKLSFHVQFIIDKTKEFCAGIAVEHASNMLDEE
ncbi:TPA: LysR family transcriptional regulator [Kluyvera ascorbata]|nr:LysR family transcriptional regulator [Kluyvera ascorbata]